LSPALRALRDDGATNIGLSPTAYPFAHLALS